jgi:hypothetical protein
MPMNCDIGRTLAWLGSLLGAGFAVVLSVELGAGWCGDDVSAGFVGVFGDGPAVGVEQCVVWFA